MAIKKFNETPATNISTWLYERDKNITPNPLKPSEKKTIKDKKIDVKNLAAILTESHGKYGKINRLIDEVDKIPELSSRMAKLEGSFTILEGRVLRLQSTVKKLQQRFNRSRSAAPPAGGEVGGPVQSIQSGKKFTRPVLTIREKNLKQNLIKNIKKLQK